MGITDWWGIGKGIAKPIQAVGDLYTTDKARLEAEAKLEGVLQKPRLAQINHNVVMSVAKSLFISGWQPLIGWTAGFLILLYYAPQIIIITVVWGTNCLDYGSIEPFPMQPDDLLNLVWLLFGFGGYSLVKAKL